MKEETMKRGASPGSESHGSNRRSVGTPDSHNALMQMYGGMYPSMPGYAPNDAAAMQYAYMYNAYLQQSMYAQHPSYMAAFYGNMNSGSYQNYASSQNGSQSTDTTTTKLDNGKYQQKSSSPKDNVRYEPYRRTSTSAPVSPVYNSNTTNADSPVIFQNGAPNSSHMSTASPWQRGSRTGSTDNINVNSEKPVDLSQKTQKLQYLSTLKDLIEAQDKKSVSKSKMNTSHGDLDNGKQDKTLSDHKRNSFNTNIHHCDTSLMNDHKEEEGDNKRSQSQDKGVTESTRPADKVGPSKALKTTEDKRAYIAVLRELFEKGHSRTSEKILAPPSAACEAQSNLNLNGKSSSVHQKQAHTPPIGQRSSVNINSQLENRVNRAQGQNCTNNENRNGNRNLVIKQEPNDNVIESENASLISVNESQNASLDSSANESADEMSIEQSLVLKTEQEQNDISYTQL